MDKRDLLREMGCDDAVVFENPEYDDAIIGVTENGSVVYDYDIMIDVLRQRGATREEAVEFIDYNTIRSLPYVRANSHNPPIVMYRLPE